MSNNMIDNKLKNNISPLAKEDKYGDDEIYESWADINIFFPIAQKLIDPLYCMGLTPNMITIISTIFTFLSIYFLHLNKRYLAFCAYLSGYILDCVDGRMARKYSMSSDIGMVLDTTSDNVSNTVLFSYILLNRPINLMNTSLFVLLGSLSYMLSLSFGLNEAISSYKSTGTDNFYEKRLKQFGNKSTIYEKGTIYEKKLFDLFLLINKISYDSYKKFFPTYDIKRINKWLKVLKHFGPGNYCLFVSILLLYI